MNPAATPPDPVPTRVTDAGAAHALPPGDLLGKYRITGRLGQGGMGVVYAAEDTTLRRPVALKVLPAARTADRAGRERFLREAQAAARLHHPNVVTVHEVGRHGEVDYIAMELVPGGSVQAYLDAHGPLPWREATRLAADACRALAAAHAAGLIHRDVKPSNLMRGGDGTAKLGDFGLAKILDAPGASLTGTGQVLGTPYYMSPEQCRAERADARSDVYALGATYYAMLAGRPPYPRQGEVEVMFAHCADPVPDPRDRVPDTPAACAAVVQRAMAKEPSGRFAGAGAMLQALQAALREGAEASTIADRNVPRRPHVRRVVVSAGVCLATLAAALLAWGLWPRPDGAAVHPAPKTPKRVVLVLPPSDFWFEEYQPLRDFLEKEGLVVTVASSARGPLHADPDPRSEGKGRTAFVDVLLNDVDATAFDALVVCGGRLRYLEAYTGDTPAGRRVRKLIRAAHAAGKHLAALGNGVTVLAAAEVLDGKRATCAPNKEAQDMVRRGGRVTLLAGEHLVVAEGGKGNYIITGRDFFRRNVEEFARAVTATVLEPTDR